MDLTSAKKITLVAACFVVQAPCPACFCCCSRPCYMFNETNKIALRSQAVLLGFVYSYGQLFEALKLETSEPAGTLALVGSCRDFIHMFCNAVVGYGLKTVSPFRMFAAGAIPYVLGMLLHSASMLIHTLVACLCCQRSRKHCKLFLPKQGVAPSTGWLFLSFGVISGASMSMMFMPAATAFFGRMSKRETALAVGFSSSGHVITLCVDELSCMCNDLHCQAPELAPLWSTCCSHHFWLNLAGETCSGSVLPAARCCSPLCRGVPLDPRACEARGHPGETWVGACCKGWCPVLLARSHLREIVT